MLILLISMLILMALVSYIYWFMPYSGPGVDLSPRGYSVTMVILALITMYSGYQSYQNWQHEQRFQVSPTKSEYNVTLQGESGDLMMTQKSPINANKAYKTTLFLWNEEDWSHDDFTLKAEEKVSGDIVQLLIPRNQDTNQEIQQLGQQLEAMPIKAQLAFPYWGIWEVAVYHNQQKVGDLVIKVNR